MTTDDMSTSAAAAPGTGPGYGAQARQDVLRDQAIKRLRKRRDFATHLLVYTLFNTFIVVIWAVVNRHGFFWPIFPIVGWGIGVVMNAWDVFRGEDFSEEQIQREMARLRTSDRGPVDTV